ncbi:MAG: hypothetical protein JWN31_1867 [Frankiales bacterium]|nr:hypothetical protein [Frankiales bacterium]
MPSRRYAPALILAAALLLLVAIAPSRGPQSSGAAAFAPFTPGPLVTAGPSGAPVPGAPLPGATAGPSGPLLTQGPSSGPTTGSGVAGALPAGDTSHCRGGKQFDVPNFIAEPPCQPHFGGGDGAGGNGGATYQGVTKSTITILFYRVKDSPAVQAVVGSTGIVPTTAQLNDFIAAETAFINSHYELWGRKVKIVSYQSPSCAGTPPSDDCFRQDARAIIAAYHPFAVLFPQNGTAPGFQDELSKHGVVNFGGLGLPSSFNTSRRPFRYDYTMDGDTQAVLLGEFYCKTLANQNARYAGDANLRAKPRKAEILVPDSEGTVQSAQHMQAIINDCDHGGGVTIKTYSQDTSQAASQSTTLASQAKQNGITTLLYFTDPIFPVYFTPQLTAQSYHPENVPVGSSFLDYDPLGQLYDQAQWANAFGLGNLAESQDPKGQDAYGAYRAGGGKKSLFISADGTQSYFSVLASGLQQAGAKLDPGTFERGLLTLPSFGGDRLHTKVQYGAGDYTGQADVRMTYWSTTATSPTNGKRGAFLPLDGGRRHAVGTFVRTPLVLPGR